MREMAVARVREGVAYLWDCNLRNEKSKSTFR
jgi:hypothetical protein